MDKMILVYVVCKDILEAKKIGKNVLKKKLASCINIFPKIHSMYFWPPNSNKIVEDEEAVLLIKSLAQNFDKITKVVEAIHSYDIPAIIKLDAKANQKYFTWLSREQA